MGLQELDGIVAATHSKHRDIAASMSVIMTHILPGGSNVVGLASLGNQLFVVRLNAAEQIEVYDTSNFTLQRNISVPGLTHAYGLACDATFYCLYATNYDKNTVHRVEFSGSNAITSWPVGLYPTGVSVTPSNDVIVTCKNDNKLQEYTTHGSLVREINLTQAGSGGHYYAALVADGQFAVSSWNGYVCVVNSSGQVLKMYDNTDRPSDQHVHWPAGIVPLKNGCLLVANNSGSKLKVLNPAFARGRDLVLPTVDGGLRQVWAVWLDESRGRLIVGEHSGNNDRIVVFDNMTNISAD